MEEKFTTAKDHYEVARQQIQSALDRAADDMRNVITVDGSLFIITNDGKQKMFDAMLKSMTPGAVLTSDDLNMLALAKLYHEQHHKKEAAK